MAETSSVAVILAGGRGECLRQGDDYIPKLMLPIGSKPLLEHHIEWLRAGGLETIILCLGLKADVVRAYFGDGSRWGVKLRYSVEASPRGTAGAVKALGAASLPENILVLCADVFCELDCRKMLEFHESHRAVATLAVHSGSKTRAKAPAEAVAESHFVSLGPSQSIMDFPPSPDDGGKPMTAAKLWIVRRALLHHVPDDRPSDFMKDVFPAALRSGESLAGYPAPEGLFDLGSPDLYESFCRRLAKKR